MRRSILLILLAVPLCAQQQPAGSLGPLEIHNVKADPETFAGVPSMRITDAGPAGLGDAGRLAVTNQPALQDGLIEADIVGDTVPNAAPDARGFVGIAFRVSGDRTRFECFYLRVKNGRAEDQLQRNHSAQYISMPGYPWQKLRAETPGKYESYTDLVPGKWTHVKIEVSGSKARLYVNGADQPALIVNDLKQTPAPGEIALWIGPGTLAHFAKVRVMK